MCKRQHDTKTVERIIELASKHRINAVAKGFHAACAPSQMNGFINKVETHVLALEIETLTDEVQQAITDCCEVIALLRGLKDHCTYSVQKIMQKTLTHETLQVLLQEVA